MRRFEFQQSGSSKFWEVGVDGSTMNIRFGKIGASGQTQVKSFASAGAATAEAEKLIKQKVGKGYVEASSNGAATPAASSGGPRFVQEVLRVSNKAGPAVTKALKSKDPRQAIAAALKGELGTKTWPAWLLVPNQPLERIVHLADPMFETVAADGDEFWGDPPDEEQLVWDNGKGTRRPTDGEDVQVGKLTDAQLPQINCYGTSGDVILASIRWLGELPKSTGAFKALLAKADEAFSGELAGYEADAATPPKASAKEAPAGPAPTTASGVHFLGGPERQAFFPTDFPKAPKVVFARAEQKTSGAEWGGTVIVGEGIAFGTAGVGYAHEFAALDARTGKTLWIHEPSKQQCFPTSQATIANGMVFIGTNRGLHALDAKTGKGLWTANLSSPGGAPLVVGDLCIVGAKKGVYALSISKKGRKVWTFPLKDKPGVIALRDGILYFLGDQTLFALSVEDGKKLHWKLKVDQYGDKGPLVTEKHLFALVESKGRELGCIDRATGKVVWRRKAEASPQGFGFAHGVLVVKDSDAVHTALDAATGKVKWTQKKIEDHYAKSPFTICDRTIVSVTTSFNDGDTFAGWDLMTGKQRWKLDSAIVRKAMAAEQKKSGSSYQGNWNYHSTPFVSDGVLYAQVDAGIVALR